VLATFDLKLANAMNSAGVVFRAEQKVKENSLFKGGEATKEMLKSSL